MNFTFLCLLLQHHSTKGDIRWKGSESWKWQQFKSITVRISHLCKLYWTYDRITSKGPFSRAWEQKVSHWWTGLFIISFAFLSSTLLSILWLTVSISSFISLSFPPFAPLHHPLCWSSKLKTDYKSQNLGVILDFLLTFTLQYNKSTSPSDSKSSISQLIPSLTATSTIIWAILLHHRAPATAS